MRVHLKNPVHPGEIFKHDFVIPMALNVTALAQVLGMPLADFWALLGGQRKFAPDISWALSDRFGTTRAF
ncbi:hypothetical protein [uncultured Roseobacter sp.]|uniref:helix-turn-helix transcriptional regulator n=1 Tax=uncultured Roseobacter sp. TaxID=114847 RepID=UPI00262327D3|nr:hypothetical protein [uncultured Roseobacter sp.]